MSWIRGHSPYARLSKILSPISGKGCSGLGKVRTYNETVGGIKVGLHLHVTVIGVSSSEPSDYVPRGVRGD
jgi:hypothetical protein